MGHGSGLGAGARTAAGRGAKQRTASGGRAGERALPDVTDVTRMLQPMSSRGALAIIDPVDEFKLGESECGAGLASTLVKAKAKMALAAGLSLLNSPGLNSGSEDQKRAMKDQLRSVLAAIREDPSIVVPA
eukprot:12984674-Alexandrium_andersonii.AAC.1